MSTNEEKRGARKVRKGTVTSKMGAKSVVVKVEYRELHPLYGKVVVRSKKYHVHDEADTAKVGDVVTIMETRPLSATRQASIWVAVRSPRVSALRPNSPYASSVPDVAYPARLPFETLRYLTLLGIKGMAYFPSLRSPRSRRSPRRSPRG